MPCNNSRSTKQPIPLSDVDRITAETKFGNAYVKYFPLLKSRAKSKTSGVDLGCSSEEIVASAVRSCWSSLVAGRIELRGENELRACLVKFVERKVNQKRRSKFALKRDGGVPFVDSVQKDENGEEFNALENVGGRDPAPDEESVKAEFVNEALSLCKNKLQRRFVELSFQGFTNNEIAKKTDVTYPTVSRPLKRICERCNFLLSSDALFEALFHHTSFETAAESAGWSVETARRVVNATCELWLKTTNKPLNFLSERDSIKNLVDLKRYVRNDWLEDLIKVYKG